MCQRTADYAEEFADGCQVTLDSDGLVKVWWDRLNRQR